MSKRVRTWTPEQRAEASQRRLKSKPHIFEDEHMVLAYGLVYHPRNTYLPTYQLAYEACMNNVTLEEWMNMHRSGKFPDHMLFYLPIGAVLIAIDENLKNVGRENLYCFLSNSDRMKWQVRTNRDITKLEVNEEEVKFKSKEYGQRIFKQRNP